MSEKAPQSNPEDIGLESDAPQQAVNTESSDFWSGLEARSAAKREALNSYEKDAEPVIKALEAKFPGSKFEFIEGTVICTDIKGIDFGDPQKDVDPARSWDNIMANPTDERFIVTIDGVDYDSRAGMTWEAYQNLIRAKSAAHEEIPDDDYFGNSTPTVTMLTGEPSSHGANCGRVIRQGVHAVASQAGVLRQFGRETDLFRPAVKIAP